MGRYFATVQPMCAVYRSRPVQHAGTLRGRVLALAGFVGACGLSACAASDDGNETLELEELATARQGIAGGETDVTRRAVLAVGSFAGGGLALCTGTLIAPNLVLTAQHCVTPTPEGTVQCGEETFRTPVSADSLGVSPATNALADGRFYAVSEVHVPPSAEDVCGGDIALLVLDGEFPGVELPPIYPRLDEPVRRGEFYTAVGYGLNLDEGVGTRRALEGLEITCGPLDCPGSEAFTKTEFVGDRGVCQGDSGGPALDPDGQVVGIVSRGTDQCDLAVYSAVSSWSEWIRRVGEHAVEIGSYERPSWLSAPELAGEAAGDGTIVAGPEDPTAAAEAPLQSGAETPRGAHASGCSLGSQGERTPPWLFAVLLATFGVRSARRRRVR
jgi:hypothetical protein